MALKRPRFEMGKTMRGEPMEEPRAKRPKTGINVGPAHLPDGTYKRHVKKIKSRLIDKAKTRQHYAKVKQRYLAEQQQNAPRPPEPATSEPAKRKPREGQEDLGERDVGIDVVAQDRRAKAEAEGEKVWHSRRKITEQRDARQLREENEARQRAINAAKQEKKQQTQKREKMRRLMAGARSNGPDGQRKLGRESEVLLYRAQKLMGVN